MIVKLIRTIFLLATLYFGITGVYLNIAQSDEGLVVLGFYTIQSNMLCILAAIFYIFQLYNPKKLSEKMMSFIQGDIVMCIMLTFLVYHFLLSPTKSFDLSTLVISNRYVHYYLPLMILADYLFFHKKGTFSYKWMPYWTFVPILYCLFVFIYSACGGRFEGGTIVPYFFLDYTRYGVLGVAKWILGLTVGYIGLSAILVSLDKLLGKLIHN